MKREDVTVLEVRVRHKGKATYSIALVDDDDAWIADKSWFLKQGYAYTRVYAGSRNGKTFRRDVQMHRMILGEENLVGLEVDHINRSRLDNRRSNLRPCTKAENAQNLGAAKRNRVGIRGVTYCPELCKSKPFRAIARVGGKNHYLGYFDRPEDAERIVRAFRAQHMPFSAEARGEEAGHHFYTPPPVEPAVVPK